MPHTLYSCVLFLYHTLNMLFVDTSSQFSVDIVEVAPRGLEMEEAHIENGGPLTDDGIVLNASKLQVEKEK